MQPHWTLNASVLYRWPYVLQLWPVEGMSSAERHNALARFVILCSLLLAYAHPGQMYWALGAVALVVLWLNEPLEMFEDKVLQNAAAGMRLADSPPKQPISQQARAAETNAGWDKIEKMANRGAAVKKEYIQNLLNNETQQALNFTRSPREMNPRGEVVWSDDQRIYGNRNYIRPSTDEYDDMFNGDVGTFKFLSRRT